MSYRIAIASSCLLLATSTLSSLASANCAMPVSYSAKVVGSTVTVTPQNYGERGCPDSSGMLRENVATGELVKLADYCSGTTAPGTATLSATSAAYVDECVPAGNYRYGFATPYSCHSSACGTEYFTTASVATALDTTCARSTGNAPPSAVATKPWSTDATICTYQSTPTNATGGAANQGAGGQPATTGGATHTAGSGAIEPSAEVPSDSDSGCSITAPTGTSTVVAVNLVALVFGLILGRRRRNRNGAHS